MDAIKQRVCSVFKDKHAAEQCNLAKTLSQTDITEIDAKAKIQRYNIVNTDLVVKSQLSDVSPSVYNDVEFMATVFSKVQQCSLMGGQLLSEHLHNTPISSIDILNRRTALLQNIENTYVANKQDIDCHLENLVKTEKYALWMFDEHEANLQEIYNIVFFRWKGIQKLNNYSGALTSYNLYRILVSPLVGIFSPIIYFIIPYLIIRLKFKIKVSFVFYIRTLVSSMLTMDTMMGQSRFFSYVRIISYMFSAVFYFQSIFSSIDISRTCNKISNLLVDNLNHVLSFIASATKLSDLCWNDSFATYFNISNHKAIDQFLTSLKPKEYTIFSNFGEQLKNYKIIKEQKLGALSLTMQKAYMIDCLLGSIKFKLARGFCYSSVVLSDKPVLKLDDMCHPTINVSKAVPNSICFGDDYGGRNAIITSPNSSGKSVLIKGIIVNVLMSQSIGVCCASKCEITPFAFINTQINVPDSTGYESLFEAEMHRCKHNLDKLCAKKNQGLSLIVMDEIFSSTNPIEAVAGAFAVCKKMSSYPTNVLIFTTHFNYLTKLAKEAEHAFINYRMGIVHDDTSGNIHFTYKFEKGVNKHLLALELLKKSGFDNDVVDEAIKIKRTLMAKKQ
jgi:hypothetical protein